MWETRYGARQTPHQVGRWTAPPSCGPYSAAATHLPPLDARVYARCMPLKSLRRVAMSTTLDRSAAMASRPITIFGGPRNTYNREILENFAELFLEKTYVLFQLVSFGCFSCTPLRF